MYLNIYLGGTTDSRDGAKISNTVESLLVSASLIADNIITVENAVNYIIDSQISVGNELSFVKTVISKNQIEHANPLKEEHRIGEKVASVANNSNTLVVRQNEIVNVFVRADTGFVAENVIVSSESADIEISLDRENWSKLIYFESITDVNSSFYVKGNKSDIGYLKIKSNVVRGC